MPNIFQMKSGLPGLAFHLFDDIMLHSENKSEMADTHADYTDVSGPISITLDILMLVANILPICVVCCTKRFEDRLAMDELIVALSITDILSVLVPSPLGLVAYFTHRWHGGAASCHFYQVTSLWFQLASMCLVTLMCLERWVALRQAMTYQLPSRLSHRVRLGIAAVYVVTFVVASLPLFGLAPPALSSSGKICQAWLTAKPFSSQQHVFFFVYLVLGYLNCITAVLVNMSLVLSLWQLQCRFGNKEAERISNSAIQIDKRTVLECSVMVLFVTILFYLTWMPALVNIIHFAFKIVNDNKMS